MREALGEVFVQALTDAMKANGQKEMRSFGRFVSQRPTKPVEKRKRPFKKKPFGLQVGPRRMGFRSHTVESRSISHRQHFCT